MKIDPIGFRLGSSVAKVLGGFLLLSPALELFRSTHTWTGATSNAWSDAGNWTGGSPAGDASPDLVFPSSSIRPSTMNDIVGAGIHSITFSWSAHFTSLPRNAIHLAG